MCTHRYSMWTQINVDYKEEKELVKGIFSHRLFPSFINRNMDILRKLSEILLTSYSHLARNDITLIYSYHKFQLLRVGHCVL